METDKEAHSALVEPTVEKFSVKFTIEQARKRPRRGVEV
jgi:hypothetical protein